MGEHATVDYYLKHNNMANVHLKNLKLCKDFVDKHVEGDSRRSEFTKQLLDICGVISDQQENACRFNNAITETSAYYESEDNVDALESDFTKVFTDTYNKQDKTYPEILHEVDQVKAYLLEQPDEPQAGGTSSRASTTSTLDQSIVLSGTTAFRVPKDPIKGWPIKVPYRNTICNHYYEKETICQYAKKGNRKCPAFGCGNREVLKFEGNVVFDGDMAAKIASTPSNWVPASQADESIQSV